MSPVAFPGRGIGDRVLTMFRREHAPSLPLRHPHLYGWVVLCAVMLLTACSGMQDGQRNTARVDPLATDLRAILVMGLTDIHSVYIEDISPETLSLAALRALDGLAPDLSIDTQKDLFRIARVGGSEAEDVRRPSGASPASWGGALAEAILAARRLSPRLAGMDGEALYTALFGAMTDQLDRFSRYAGRDATRANRAEREGYGGIGVTIRSHPEGALIEAVDADTPAAAAGLAVDDVIVAIDDTPMAGRALATVAERLRGPVEVSVTLTIRRQGIDPTQDVEVGRTRIVPNTVQFSMEGGLAVVRLTGFNRLTAKRMAEALARAQSTARPRLVGAVLDLRGNLGGVVDQAIEAADLLLDKGIILETYGRHPRSRQHFEAEPGDVTGGLPIVVLIDGASASSAEILASALQDNDRAVVVGATSFGKGSVQTVLPLEPNDAELILTWAEFVAPSGYALNHVGVLPSLCTAGRTNAQAALRRALANDAQVLRRAFAIRRATDNRNPEARRRAQALCPWQPAVGEGDVDMDAARAIIQSPAVYQALRSATRPEVRAEMP